MLNRKTLYAAGVLLALLAAGCGGDGAGEALLDPSLATEKAPAQFKIQFATTKGDFVVEVHRDWAPLGADRLYNLVKIGFFDDTGFFRVVPGFVVQFGIHGNPAVNQVWHAAHIGDDPVKLSNVAGTVSFATAGPGTRTTQLFINYGDNSSLDRQGFAPLGKVIQGMDVVENIYPGYQQRPNQGLIQQQGNAYLKGTFPEMDFITKATLIG